MWRVRGKDGRGGADGRPNTRKEEKDFRHSSTPEIQKEESADEMLANG